jgi:hypothetical protein
VPPPLAMRAAAARLGRAPPPPPLAQERLLRHACRPREAQVCASAMRAARPYPREERLPCSPRCAAVPRSVLELRPRSVSAAHGPHWPSSSSPSSSTRHLLRVPEVGSPRSAQISGIG